MKNPMEATPEELLQALLKSFKRTKAAFDEHVGAGERALSRAIRFDWIRRWDDAVARCTAFAAHRETLSAFGVQMLQNDLEELAGSFRAIGVRSTGLASAKSAPAARAERAEPTVEILPADDGGRTVALSINIPAAPTPAGLDASDIRAIVDGAIARVVEGLRSMPAPVVNVSPRVEIEMPETVIPPAVVNVEAPDHEPVRLRVKRDSHGRLEEIFETGGVERRTV